MSRLLRSFTARILAIGALAGAAPATAGAQHGPSGTWYLTAGESQSAWRIQGDSAVAFPQSWGGDTYALAVSGDIRTLANGNIGFGSTSDGATGTQYSLDYVATGATYAYPLAGHAFYDGTTDGTYNYAVSYNTEDVWRFDRNWSSESATRLFGGLTLSPLGITYDPRNNSLWISQFSGTMVSDYAMDGTLNFSFSTDRAGSTALALDYTDETLWLGAQGTEGTFYQYSRTGTLLQTVTYANMVGQNTLGGEFDFIPTAVTPEPATWVLVGVGLASLGGIAARRRRIA